MNKSNNPTANDFINQIEDIAGKLDELTKISPGVKYNDSLNHFQILIPQLKKLPEKELVEAYNGLKDLPGWVELPGRIDNITEKVKQVSSPNPSTVSTNPKPQQNCTLCNFPKVKQALGPTIPKPPICPEPQAECTLGDCPTTPTQAQVDDLLIAVAAGDLATAIAQATADTIAIFSDRAGKIAQAIASGLDVVGKGLALAASILQKQLDLVAECEDQAVKELLLTMCNTINTIDRKADLIIYKLEIIDLKLDSLIKLAHKIKDVVDEILLHQIEEALSECKMLVSLFLPDNSFGSVNKVENILRKLINYAKVSGITVANAESYWKQGAIALSSNQYEKALEWFMLAYKQIQTKDMCAVPCPGDPC